MNFLGRPVFDVRPDHSSLRVGQLDDLKLDGVIATPWRATTKLKRRVTLPFLFGTRAEWRAFRDFFASRRGQLDGFWLPVWMGDLFADGLTPSSTTVDIPPIGLTAMFVAGEQHGFCAVISPTALEAHKINGVAIVSLRERLTLNEALGTFSLSETMVCPMLFCRLGGELSYEFLTDGAVRCEIKFEELPAEYSGSSSTSRPIWCYEITRGTTVWRLTNWTEAVIDNEGSMWTPDPISHDRLQSGLDFISEAIKVSTSTESAAHPLRYWVDRNAMENMSLSIFKLDADTLTIDRANPIYFGRLENAEYPPGGKVRVNATSIFRIGEQNSPKVMCQRTCVHRLFDQNCAVSEAAFTTVGTIGGLGDDWVEAAAFGIKASAEGDANWFSLGTVTVGNERRLVVGEAGSRLYLDEPFLNAAIGQDISATAGCNKRILTCLNKFNNLGRTIQFPYIPNRNPQFQALEVPKAGGGKKG
jgi:hypothetical protein